jgi:hypothetical protein
MSGYDVCGEGVVSTGSTAGMGRHSNACSGHRLIERVEITRTHGEPPLVIEPVEITAADAQSQGATRTCTLAAEASRSRAKRVSCTSEWPGDVGSEERRG